MNPDQIDVVIARRTFQVKGGREAELIIGAPQPFTDGDYFRPFQVTGLGDARVYYAGGVDAYQALILALKKITIHLLTLPEVVNGEVQWLDGSEPNLGLLASP
ncbi:DUF6968 family protein [Dyella monticola]|nr:hypothetical protein [Dyella monticola]